jgi:hypothetical protein
VLVRGKIGNGSLPLGAALSHLLKCTKTLRDSHGKEMGHKGLRSPWSADNPRIPDDHLDKLDELATERLSATYASSKAAGRAQVLAWLSDST